MNIYQASLEDIAKIVPLFDAYRQFYGQSSNVLAAQDFLTQRFKNQENIVFLAEIESQAVGFTQLYHTFSSVSLQPFLILNDLYVDKNHRRQSVGTALLNSAKAYAVERKFKGLALETAVDNPAQELYEKMGWKKNSKFFQYFWTAEN